MMSMMFLGHEEVGRRARKAGRMRGRVPKKLASGAFRLTYQFDEFRFALGPHQLANCSALSSGQNAFKSLQKGLFQSQVRVNIPEIGWTPKDN